MILSNGFGDLHTESRCLSESDCFLLLPFYYKSTDLPVDGNERWYHLQKKGQSQSTKKRGKKWYNKHKYLEQAGQPDRQEALVRQV